MGKTKNSANNSVFKTTNGSECRNIRALSGDYDQAEWITESIQKPISRTIPPRISNLVHPDDCNVFKKTIETSDRESFHCAMGSILLVAQFFGILPLSGVHSESPSKLDFKILSPKTAYTGMIILMLFTMTLATTCNMIVTVQADSSKLDGRISKAASNWIFYINSLIGTILFVRLAPHWISLQHKWRAMEQLLDRETHQTPRLRRKFSVLVTIVTILAIMENVSSYIAAPPFEFWSSATNKTFKGIIKSITVATHPFIFTICDYNFALGIFVLTISTIAAFTWNFMDLFIMLVIILLNLMAPGIVSSGLVERYKTLNRRLKVNISTCRHIDWRMLRKSYATLSILVKSTDKNISPIILLSFVNNFYFICLQLLIGLSPQMDNLLGSIYGFGSFMFLVGRTIALTLLVAQINDQSKIALPELFICPESAYDIEAQRLQQQLSVDTVCLTGMQFFSITRNFMLTVAGTIVTYEVLLLNSTQ